jgi:hypothetical protein
MKTLYEMKRKLNTVKVQCCMRVDKYKYSRQISSISLKLKNEEN